jgi:DNA-binding GntR family transcriptional regulator
MTKLDMPDGTRAANQVLRVAETLKQMIINNELAPGSNLLESELSRMLGVSRTPIREAAVILEGRGLVEIIPRRGIRIVPLTISDMEEIYDILTELEPLAAARAAELRLPDAAFDEVEDCLARMERALSGGDRLSWAAADDEFHSRLVALSGNGRLMQVVGMFSDQVHRARLLTLHMRPLPHASNENHRALVDAIRRGKAEEARRIHREHRLLAKDLLIGILKQHGLRQF